jgi:small subunit ribosomal protein S16
MTLKIRLRQQGRKNQTVYRLVITDSRSPRDGKYIETLGWYNPIESDPARNFKIEAERVQYWLNLGAQLTEKAATVVRRGAPEIAAIYRQKLADARAKACQKRKQSRKNKELATAQ